MSAEQQTLDIPLFTPVINEFMKAPSMILIGEYGSGKTHIRNYRLAPIKNENIIVEIYGNKVNINSYFDNFLVNIGNINKNEQKSFKSFFKGKDLMDIFLSELVQKLLKDYPEELDKMYDTDLSKFTFEERFRIASILSVYLKNRDQAMRFLNDLLYDKVKCSFFIFNCELVFNGEPNDNELDIMEAYNNFRISSNQDKKFNVRFLHTLSRFYKLDLAFIFNPFESITFLSNFIRKMFGKSILVVIDSLDESPFFFDKGQQESTENKGKLDDLQHFIDTAVTPEILKFGLGNINDVTFNILIFLPAVEGAHISKWNRVDKIPIVSLKWDIRMLLNYADFMINFMRVNAIDPCKKIPNLKQLLNDTDNLETGLGSLRNPRDLHRFMNHLIEILNMNVRNNNEAFIATKSDVEEALNKTMKNMVEKYLKISNKLFIFEYFYLLIF